MKQTQYRNRGRSKLLTLLNTLLAVILALMLGVTVLAYTLMNKMNRVEMPEIGDIFNATSLNGEDWGNSSESLLGKERGIVNILLIGQDERGSVTGKRSDTMILVTVNKQKKAIVMTSFLRDLYVEIPGYSSNRLNASYAWGGMGLLNRTLEQNFGIYIDGNVEVDFGQFSDIIDLLGGVTIELRSDEAKHINKEIGSSLTEGPNLLSGKEALEYVRIRKLDADGDFSRTQRQRTLINAILRDVKDGGLVDLLHLVNDVLPMITTDMSNTEILGYATALLPLLSGAEITSQRIPADGAYAYASVDGMSVLKPDLEANRQLLRETLGN